MLDNFWDFPPTEPEQEESQARPELVLAIVQAARAFEYALDAQASDAYLTALQARVACELSESPNGLPLVEIARRLRMSKQATGQLLGRMAQRGLVQHLDHPLDGRCTLVALTNAGHRQWEKVNRSLWIVERRLLRDLGAGHTPLLIAVLAVVRDLDERTWS